MRDINEIETALSGLAQRQRLRERQVLSGQQGSHVVLDGQSLLSFASNDYLGLAGHPKLRQAVIEAVAQEGVGACASHLLTGHHERHQAAEIALAEFTGLNAALLMSTGYMANLSVITSLSGRKAEIFADKLNHASLVDAALLSRARHRRYRHLDMNHLEDLLKTSVARTKLIATDTVFSMDGHLAPLSELVALSERYEAWLYLDDAHGFGVLGSVGQGILDQVDQPSERIIYMATLGKAAGVSGAFVAGHRTVIDWLVNTARPYVYTTAMPPSLSAGVMASLDIIRNEGWRRERLLRHISRLKAASGAWRWRSPSPNAPIQPLLVGEDREALNLSLSLLNRGILIPAIRPPTVPEGGARLRISLSAAHEDTDVDRLIAELRALSAC